MSSENNAKSPPRVNASAYVNQPSYVQSPPFPPSNGMMPYNTQGFMPYAMPGTMPGAMPGAMPSTPGFMPSPTVPSFPPGTREESYVENILRMNLGKHVTIYMTFENNSAWNNKIFKGQLEAAGRDHIIISDPSTGARYLLLMVNLDYITFDGPLNYTYYR